MKSYYLVGAALWKCRHYANMVLFISLITILDGCSISKLEEDVLPANLNSVAEGLDYLSLTPEMEGNYLVFVDNEHFRQFAAYLSGLENEDRLLWENSLGFQSMLSAYKEFLTYSENSIATGYDLSITDIQKKYTPSVLFGSEGSFSINTPLITWASILNKEGMVKIGSSIHQYSKSKMISIVGGDLQKLNFAQRLEESDPELGIFIQNISAQDSSSRTICQEILLGSGDWPGAVTTLAIRTWLFDDPHDNSSNARFRLIVECFAYQWGSGAKEAAVVVEMKTSERGLFGAWFAKSAQTVLTVNNASITNNQGYSETINNLNVSKNDNDWFKYLFSSATSHNPMKIIFSQNNGNHWDDVCLDLNFITTFTHNNTSDTYSRNIN